MTLFQSDYFSDLSPYDSLCDGNVQKREWVAKGDVIFSDIYWWFLSTFPPPAFSRTDRHPLVFAQGGTPATKSVRFNLPLRIYLFTHSEEKQKKTQFLWHCLFLLTLTGDKLSQNAGEAIVSQTSVAPGSFSQAFPNFGSHVWRCILSTAVIIYTYIYIYPAYNIYKIQNIW